MLPRHGTTASEVQVALQHCGIAPESIAWSVYADGSFAFGRKSDAAAPMTETKTECLMRWIEDNKIRVTFLHGKPDLAKACFPHLPCYDAELTSFASDGKPHETKRFHDA